MLPIIDRRDLARRQGWEQGERAGYAHQLYAESLAEFGTAIRLDAAGATLLRRRIPNADRYDCIGCYPLFVCERVEQLHADLERLPSDVVSVAVVTDPWSAADDDTLAEAFDFVKPFKTHYVVDLDIPFEAYLHRHHRRYAKRALLTADVTLAVEPVRRAEEWVQLYRHLTIRHGIRGLAEFSARSLSLQLEVPGCHYFRAVVGGQAEAALVCFVDRGVVYAHLISTTSQGQRAGLQYALYWTAIEAFRGRAKWFALGSTPGLSDGTSTTGLGFFKAGWATGTCQSYFCGRIQDRDEYARLCPPQPDGQPSFFPAYRSVA